MSIPSKKSYALIYLPNKTIKKFYDTAAGAKNDYPNAALVELFNCNGIKLSSIKN